MSDRLFVAARDAAALTICRPPPLTLDMRSSEYADPLSKIAPGPVPPARQPSHSSHRIRRCPSPPNRRLGRGRRRRVLELSVRRHGVGNGGQGRLERHRSHRGPARRQQVRPADPCGDDRRHRGRWFERHRPSRAPCPGPGSMHRRHAKASRSRRPPCSRAVRAAAPQTARPDSVASTRDVPGLHSFSLSARDRWCKRTVIFSCMGAAISR